MKYKTEKLWPSFPRFFNFDRFEIESHIASGGYAFVYYGQDHKFKKKIAIKIPNLSRTRAISTLKKEKKYLLELHIRGVRVPKVLWFGQCYDRLVLVMELLGDCLGDIKKNFVRNFSISTILRLSKDLIRLCEKIHDSDILHRDCKLKNYILGFDLSHIYIIDFGLSGRWKIKKNNQHIFYKKYLLPYGTIRYAPLAVHVGNEQGRKEDLEAMCYLLIYLVRGNLPWQFFWNRNKKTLWNNVGKIKLEIPLSELCSGLPSCFKDFLFQIYSLKFIERPHYEDFKKIFVKSMKNLNINKNESYDWQNTNSKIKTGTQITF